MANIYEKIYHIFDSNGKIAQVEYALNAVANSTQMVSLCSDDAVVVVNKRVATTALQEEEVKCVYQVAENVFVAITGIHGDTVSVINKAIELANAKEYSLGCTLTPDIFVRSLADKFQKYIQTSALRCPAFSAHVFGTLDGKCALYYTDLSAIEYKCFGVASGEGDSKMKTYLEKNYKAGMDINTLVSTGITSLLQSIGREAEHTEICVTIYDKTGIREMTSEEIDKHLQDIAEKH